MNRSQAIATIARVILDVEDGEARLVCALADLIEEKGPAVLTDEGLLSLAGLLAGTPSAAPAVEERRRFTVINGGAA